MSNDEAQAFVECVHNGTYEQIFWYRKQKFMLQWTCSVSEPTPSLLLERWIGVGDWRVWEEKQNGCTREEVVEKFLQAKLWDGRSFWSSYHEMEWVDE